MIIFHDNYWLECVTEVLLIKVTEYFKGNRKRQIKTSNILFLDLERTVLYEFSYGAKYRIRAYI